MSVRYYEPGDNGEPRTITLSDAEVVRIERKKFKHIEDTRTNLECLFDFITIHWATWTPSDGGDDGN